MDLNMAIILEKQALIYELYDDQLASIKTRKLFGTWLLIAVVLQCKFYFNWNQKTMSYPLSGLDSKVGIRWLPVAAPLCTPGQARSCSKSWKVLIERFADIFWFVDWCI